LPAAVAALVILVIGTVTWLVVAGGGDEPVPLAKSVQGYDVRFCPSPTPGSGR